MGKPILLGVEGESQGLLERSAAGLCFTPEDESDFLRQLNRLATDETLYAACQENCTALARDYDRGKLANDMLAVLKEAMVEKGIGNT
jgi:hypothetical protein